MEEILKYFTHLTQKQIQQLQMLDGLYHEWNAKINVISRKDIDSLYGEYQAGEESEGKTPLTSYSTDDVDPKEVFDKTEGK